MPTTVKTAHPITGQEYTLTLHGCEQIRNSFAEIGANYIFRIPSQAAAHVAHQWRTIKAYFYGKFPASEANLISITAGHFSSGVSCDSKTVKTAHPITGQEYTLTLHGWLPLGITHSWAVAFCAVADAKKAAVYFWCNAVREYLAVFWVNHTFRSNFCEAVPDLFAAM